MWSAAVDRHAGRLLAQPARDYQSQGLGSLDVNRFPIIMQMERDADSRQNFPADQTVVFTHFHWCHN